MTRSDATYAAVFGMLGIDGVIQDIAKGAIKLPSAGLQSPFRDFGFPPALIPIWNEVGMRYAGIWKHWFTSRMPSYVVMDIELGHLVWEVGRTSRQLFMDLVAQLLGHSLVVNDVERFATLTGIDLAEIRRARARGGFYRFNLLTLSDYATGAPLVCFEHGVGYAGDFPSEAMELTLARMRNCCTLEADELLRPRIAASNNAPPWFRVDEQSNVFNALLASGDLQGAWMSLNSNGWNYAEAKKAIQRLAKAGGDPKFALLADAWCARPHEHFGGY